MHAEESGPLGLSARSTGDLNLVQMRRTCRASHSKQKPGKIQPTSVRALGTCQEVGVGKDLLLSNVVPY